MKTKILVYAIIAVLLCTNLQAVRIYAVDENVRTAYEEAKSVKEKADGDYNSAKERISALESELATISAADYTALVDKAYKNWQSAIKKVANAENQYNSVKSAYDAACAEYNRGSYGFFEYMGSDYCAGYLDHAGGYNEVGAPEDATNLDNMKLTFKFLRECNDLRAKEGLSELMITDSMMACAQAGLNYGRKEYRHSVYFGVGENLAWGYSDPFDGWYTEEKATYLTGSYTYVQVGHYLNIIEPSYKVTGFACAYSSSGLACGQTFLYDSSDEINYTVDEYESKFMNYYNMVTNEMNRLKPSLDAASSTLESAKNDRDAFENAYNEVKQQKESASLRITEIRSELSELKQMLASLEKAKETAALEYESAKKAYDDALATNETKESSRADSESTVSNSSSISSTTSNIDHSKEAKMGETIDSSDVEAIEAESDDVKSDNSTGNKYIIPGIAVGSVSLIGFILLLVRRKKKH